MIKGKLLRVLYHLLPAITVGFGLYIANNVWIAMLSYHTFVVLILLCKKQGYQYRRIFIGGSIGKAFLGSLVALTSGIAIFVLGLFLNIAETIKYSLLQMGLSGYGWLIFIIYYSLVNPVIEEVYWRGFLGSNSSKLSWSDIGYGGYHPLVFLKFLAVPWAILEFFILVGIGWFWRGMTKNYDGLFIPFAMHLSADLSIAIAIWMLVRG
jgi:membrane protease YdiL (CAAX protease family)